MNSGTGVSSKRRNAMRGRIRTPPVRAEVSAAIKLFLVNPIQTAIENLRAAVARQRAFATLHAEIFDVQDCSHARS